MVQESRFKSMVSTKSTLDEHRLKWFTRKKSRLEDTALSPALPGFDGRFDPHWQFFLVTANTGNRPIFTAQISPGNSTQPTGPIWSSSDDMSNPQCSLQYTLQ